METTVSATTRSTHTVPQPKKRPRSIFDLPENFFSSCRLLPPGKHSFPAAQNALINTLEETPLDSSSTEEFDQLCNISESNVITYGNMLNNWSCHTCNLEFDSLVDQRSHFKSDIHRFNVKLSLAGKNILKEDDLDELSSDSFSKDFDVSSISGSEDDGDGPSRASSNANKAQLQSVKQKIYVRLHSGEKVSIWKSLILRDSETLSCENDQLVVVDDKGGVPCFREIDVIAKLKVLTHEPRDNTRFRIVLLASGGHFAGCVFDGTKVVASKTFHRYVVRAKAGKQQSSKDGSGRSIHSAGASLRRYNELSLKKNIQELLASWKPYFDASSCVFISASINNRQIFFSADSPLSSNQNCDVRKIPFIVKRPTFKEAQRVYGQLCQITFEVDEELPDLKKLELHESCEGNLNSVMESMSTDAKISNGEEACETTKMSDEQLALTEIDTEVISTTPLHEAAKSGDVEMVLELLEQGLDPTLKDDRGRTPYTVAIEKEVRNTFRRFMASNLEKWDWHAANVPSPLTKEMEESQAAKQAEKDAKRKAKAKELKKLRREKEKKAKAEAAESQKASLVSKSKAASSSSDARSVQSGPAERLSKEEELKRKLAEERDKRAAAAERRMAMASASTNTAQGGNVAVTPSISQSRTGNVCSCCNASLDGVVPFHRYNYKYCSTTCMKVHKEVLEDG